MREDQNFSQVPLVIEKLSIRRKGFNSGSAYSSSPTIAVKAGTGGGGAGFSATGIPGSDEVTGFNQISGGTGYAPTATVDPDDPAHPDSIPATLMAVIENDQTNADFGKITAFTLIDGGRGYVDDSSLRIITASLAGLTATGTAGNDPGELSFLMDDNGTPGDDSDDFPIKFDIFKENNAILFYIDLTEIIIIIKKQKKYL